MNGWRSTALWQAVLCVALIAAWLAGGEGLRNLTPLLVVAALLYLLARTAFAYQRAGAEPLPAAAPAAGLPRIRGSIARPERLQPLDPEQLQADLAAQVVGQEAVTLPLARELQRRIQQGRRGKPLFSALLAGPSGSGKTALGVALAESAFGANSLLRIDGARTVGAAGLWTLIGTPRNQGGSGAPGVLSTHLRARPRSVILFDEVDKALPTLGAPLAALLLALLDDGAYTDQGDGGRVSAAQAILVLTSNAGAARFEALHQEHGARPDELFRANRTVLREHFAPEFLARIDFVATLAPLDEAAQARLVTLHGARIGAAHGVTIAEIDASFIDQTLKLWTPQQGYGTAEIVAWLGETLAGPLAAARKRGATRLRLLWMDGRAVVRSL